MDENESDSFKKDVENSIKYLKQSESGNKIITTLENSETIYTIKSCDPYDTTQDDAFDEKDNTIYWCPRYTIEGRNGNSDSSSICLMHELTHAYDFTTPQGNQLYNEFIKHYPSLLENRYQTS